MTLRPEVAHPPTAGRLSGCSNLGSHILPLPFPMLRLHLASCCAVGARLPRARKPSVSYRFNSPGVGKAPEPTRSAHRLRCCCSCVRPVDYGTMSNNRFGVEAFTPWSACPCSGPALPPAPPEAEEPGRPSRRVRHVPALNFLQPKSRRQKGRYRYL